MLTIVTATITNLREENLPDDKDMVATPIRLEVKDPKLSDRELIGMATESHTHGQVNA